MNIRCWCGSGIFETAQNPDYQICSACGTASLTEPCEIIQKQVLDEANELYGANYWNEHMVEQGYPDLFQRSRLDLTSRNLYWLKALLKYRLPPLKTLEIGCAHGSFVKLLKLAGFDSSGLEMSPNVISLAKKWFEIEIHQGPVEYIPNTSNLYDVILAFDVIEHFPDPVMAIEKMAAKLSDDGLFVIQTPDMDLCTGKLWRQFNPPEHTFLFSKQGLRSFFSKLGFTHFAVEPACFEDDQFLFISKEKLIINSCDAIDKSLMATPNGRIALALSELYENYQRERLQCIQKHGGGRKLLKELVKVFLRRLTSLTSQLFLK